MNITKDYFEYVSNVNGMNPIFEQYKFKCNKYSPMYKCNRLLIRIKEVENNINQLSIISKKSSSFNNRSNKVSNAMMDIQKTFQDIETEITDIKSKELTNNKINRFYKLLLQNSLDILSNKISNISIKFKKLLELQAKKIREIQQRTDILNPSQKIKINKNNSFNEYAADFSSNNYDEDDVLLEVKDQQQTFEQNNSQYYQNRLKDVQLIEKTMKEISEMMNRLSQMTYEQSFLIENISRNTDIALDHVEKGEKEVKKILENVKNNRWLLIRIFMIIICVSVFYIIFMA